MQKFCRINVFAFILFIISACPLPTFAQTDIPVGTGTTSNSDWDYPCPLPDSYGSMRMQFLYLASEMTAAGMTLGSINAIRFTIDDLGMYFDPANSLTDRLIIKIGSTSSGTLNQSTWEPGTSVVVGPIDYLPVVGQNTFTFSTPFFWNGVDNIVIEMCTDGTITGNRTANVHVNWTTGLAFNGSHSMGELFTGGMCNATGYSNMGTATSRPNIIFNYTSAAPCTSGTLTAGTAVSNLASVCIDEPFKLRLNGASLATGLSYQWQSSTDHVSWTDINKATEAALTTKQNVTTWYRAIVTCASGGTATSADVQVITPLPLSGTYTIDQTLPAGGGNFKTFNDAYNFIKCGINGPVVFNVAPGSGTYNEQITLFKVPGSSAANTITFNGATGAAIEFAPNNTNDRAVIKLNGADHFVFNNLTVNATGTYGYGFQLLSDADSNMVNGCTINTNASSFNSNYAGIVVSSSASSATQQGAALCDWNTFSGNTITGGYYGITLVGSSSAANGNNKIINNRIEEFASYGLYIACSFNTQVDNNVISRPTRSNDYSTIYGIYTTNINTKMSISKNIITHIFSGGAGTENASCYGIYAASAAALGGLENIVSNNLIYNINGGGTVYGIYNSQSHNTLYYHNTISLDGDGSTVPADKAVIGFYQTDATGVKFFNNNIVLTRSGQATNTAIYFNTPATDLESNRNNLYVTAGAGDRQTGYINGAGQKLLSDWVAASGRDVNSINADPLFVDLATGDLTPANPALDNAGANVGVTVDIKGTTRNNPPDIGAFEFSPPPCVTPPTPGTSVLSVSSICVGESLTISLTGNSVGAGQTYQLESSPNAGGPFTALGSVSANPVFSFTATTTMYYRIATTCSGNTVYTPAVQLTVFQAFPSGTYTIDKNAAPSATNFTSFTAAKEALACGIAGPIVFNVAPNSGPYNEQLVFTPVKGASVINTITFNGNGNILQFSSNDYNEKAVIKLRNADHFIFDSLVIDATGTGSYGFGIQFINNADSNTVRKCIINTDATSGSDGYAGIVISATDGEMYSTGDTWCDNNLFEGNTITGGYWGVAIAGDPVYFSWMSNFIYDNKLINNTIRDFYDRGIYVIGTERTVIENNIIERPVRASVGSFYGIYVDATSGDLTIRRNRITNPFGGNPTSTQSFYGMYFDFAGHELKGNVTNNLIYNINGNGTLYGLYLNSSREFNFHHNTISFDNLSVPGTNTSSANGVYAANSAGNIEFRNNIVTITRGGSGLKFGFNVSSGDVIGFALDKNDYYINGAGGNNHIGYRNANRTTLADWQSATHRDAHSYSIDPVYMNPAAGNYAPTIAPLNNNGDPLGVLKDIQNQDRSTTTPDIGAYEFAPAPCLSGVIAGTAAATPNSGICMGTTITLSLSGNTTSGFQTYRWEKSVNGSSDWQRISDTLYVSTFKTEATGNAWYRCIVSCTGLNDTSTKAQVQINAPLAKGIYTINSSGGNYASFAAAVAALQCGIAGEVIFDVAPGTYNEQVLIRRIPGASDTSRVTFRAANGDPTSVVLTAAGTSTANYVLKLDSAHYLTFKNLSITATAAANARVVEIAGNSSYDSLLNNIITTVTTTNTATSRAAVFASPLKGDGIVIMDNTINNGASGIYIAGTSINRNRNLVVAGNTVKGFYQYGIYTSFNNRSRITGNNVTVAAPANSTAYGIYTADADSSFVVKNNNVQISNTTTTIHGIYFLRTIGRVANPGVIEANKVTALTGITGTLYGINVNSAAYASIVNNVVSIKTSGASSYGLNSSNNIRAKVFNNTILSTATSATNNVAAWFGDNGDELQYADIRNNIFSHEGGGVALFISDNSWSQLQRLYSDYNLLYTSGATLVKHGTTASYATLPEWQQGGDLDANSIVFKPALVSAANPEPNVTAPEVWAIHGRGVQISDNDHDFNNQPRPVSLKAGVPDLGAYEFVPTSVPVAAVATPAAPAPNTQQVFMLGTDTVSTITWGATVPSSATVRRYSGSQPNNLATGMDYMYFYTDVDITGTGSYTYSIDQHYLDPWRGFIDNEARIRLGRTNNTGAWTVDAASTVDNVSNVIAQTSLDFIDQFTGLTDPTIAYPPTDSSRIDTLNKGTRFWVGYGHNNQVETFTIRMGGSDKDANVTIKVHGTSWIRRYQIPAHSYIMSEPIPRNGASGALLATEGLSDRGISIESDEPIAAYTFCEGALAVTGSTMLLPVGAYGYEYYALSYSQMNFEINVHSWFYVIADHDSTLVEITPAMPTVGGRTGGVPFVITLNKGEVYQVLGAIKTENESYDMSGSKVRSLSNASGNCYPVAVFSGNSRAFIDCAESFVPFGNYLIQQNYPVQTWGTKYLTAPTSRYGEPTTPLMNFYRVLVKDPATVVKKNGVALTGLNGNHFYEFHSADADYIESDQPVMVAQFIPGSSNDCDFGSSGPEIFYLPAIEQGIRQADFYRTTPGFISENYLTLIIPTPGLTSLKIDGDTKFDSTYTHPNLPGYTVVIKKWDGAETSSSVQADTTFTAISYGLGGLNTYGYTVGKAIIHWPMHPGITNNYDSSGHFSAFTCVGTPFKYSVLLPVIPTRLTWQFSKAANMVPDADSVQVNPVPNGTQTINGRTYYRFDLKKEYVFPAVGNYTVPIEYEHPVIESCNNTMTQLFTVQVVGAPVVDINAVTTGCVGDTVQFSATVAAQNGDVVHTLHWNFGDNTTSDVLMPKKLYAAAGTYNIKADAITQVGCIASVTEPLVLKGPAAFDFTSDTVRTCANTAATLTIQNPETGVVYNWYDAATGGSALHTGSSHTINPLTATKTFYVEAVKDGCATKPRQAVTALLLPAITTPVARVDSIGTTVVRFAWNAVPDAAGYQVSTDNGATWSTPSSGANGLTHTITGLQGGQTVTLLVKALDPNHCQDKISAPVSTTTLPSQVFIPNAFSPNNDGLNDEFKVEGFVVRSLQLRVFNQWGEMVFESTDQNRGWDGKHKGKLQPSGVYMYVCKMTLTDGTQVVRKGAVNLVR